MLSMGRPPKLDGKSRKKNLYVDPPVWAEMEATRKALDYKSISEYLVALHKEKVDTAGRDTAAAADARGVLEEVLPRLQKLAERLRRSHK